ncbi:hypothetical protein HS088_TW18G00419 [Tripterygium wilfordii]|uniref:Uncharacterized protein n=1 Tax=Tripterygium wilfordii TaxID=458696 RepID=A0A7J7CC34_TRIWF|nr:hypothetical protein HS088_TW18G00419 [Tripterygium wilfordii]
MDLLMREWTVIRESVDEKSMSQGKSGADDEFLDDTQEGGGGDCVADIKNTMSEAVKKCLEENKGDHSKC